MNEYVTVFVLSYNSAKTILETLDSILYQTYPYLDLFINDDASKDDSVSLIQKWIIINRERFRNISVNVNAQNMGINYSFDNGIKRIETEWVKTIAADDILHLECISRNMDYVNAHGVKTILFSNELIFSKSLEEGRKRELYEEKYMEELSALSAEKQYRKLLKRNIYYSSTIFLNSNVYKSIGGITTEVRNIDDSALVLKFTSTGNKLYFMNLETTYYRVSNSVSRSEGSIYSKGHIEQTYLLNKLLVYPNIPFYHFGFWYDEAVAVLRYFIIIKILRNKNTRFSRIVNSLLMVFSIRAWKKLIFKIYMSFISIVRKAKKR